MSAQSRAANHPLAWRMALIAALAQNVGVGLMFGSFGVLLEPLEAQFGVGRDLIALGVSMVMIDIAVLTLVVGALSIRFTLRALMMFGAVLSVVGYLALSVVTHIVHALLVYALLVGPGLVFLSIVLPSALIARWFSVGRGRALGLVNMPVLVMLTPVVTESLLSFGGLAAAYRGLAFISALVIPALWFIRENPTASADNHPVNSASNAGAGLVTLIRSHRYWAMCMAAAAMVASGTTLSTHVVSMAISWGVERSHAALLISVMAGAGMAGSVAFGWLADRIGGNWALAVNCFAQMLLWSVLLLQPGFSALVIVIGLIGICTGAVISTFGTALAEHFGPESFGRAYGLSNLINLPVIAGASPLAAWIFVQAGSYVGAILTTILFLGSGVLLAVLSRGHGQAPRTSESVIAVHDVQT